MNKTDYTSKEILVSRKNLLNQYGFSLVELIVVVALISILAAIAIPYYQGFTEKARTARCIAEIRNIEFEISSYIIDNGSLPDSLAQLGTSIVKDPFGSNYQYINLINHPGSEYIDFGANPLNDDYDLYSMGPDKASSQDLSQDNSQDDIVRGLDGGWIGTGSAW